MHQIIDPRCQLDEQDIAAIELDHRSRDDIPRLLCSVQYIHTEIDVRERVFAVLAEMLPERVDGNGAVSAAPGMPQCRILVVGTLRRRLNAGVSAGATTQALDRAG